MKAAEGRTSVLKPEAGTQPNVFYIGLDKELAGRVEGGLRHRNDVAPNTQGGLNMNTIVEVLGFAREPGWLPWAVQYFFLIGISAAAFFLSLPGLVWRRAAGQASRGGPAGRAGVRADGAGRAAGRPAPDRAASSTSTCTRTCSWMAWGSFFIPLYVGAAALCLVVPAAAAGAAWRAKAGPRTAAIYRAVPMAATTTAARCVAALLRPSAPYWSALHRHGSDGGAARRCGTRRWCRCSSWSRRWPAHWA